jgi:hypothetical protein
VIRHLVTVAAVILAVWTLTAIPLGIAIGRRLRKTNATTTTGGPHA